MVREFLLFNRPICNLATPRVCQLDGAGHDASAKNAQNATAINVAAM